MMRRKRIMKPKYLVASEWRVRLKVATMRVKDNLAEVIDYLRTLYEANAAMKEYYDKHKIDFKKWLDSPGMYRVYEFTDEQKAPVLIKRERLILLVGSS